MFTLTIETDNAAFEDGNVGRELVRILQKLTKNIEAYAFLGDVSMTGKLLDSNGNTVGSWRLDP